MTIFILSLSLPHNSGISTVLIAKSVITALLAVWVWTTNFLGSEPFPSLIAPLLATYFGLKIFLGQQRIARVQRIYYEESLLELLKHLDEGINITNQNLAQFENVINLIKRNQSSDMIKEIGHKINAPIIYQLSKKEIVISLFGKDGYIVHDWFLKFDKDLSSFNLLLRERILHLSSHMLRVDNKNFDLELKQLFIDVENEHGLILRHFTLSFLFNNIVSIIGTLDFTSRKKLIKDIQKNSEIHKQLKKIDETFKVLFAYYKIGKNTFLSYLISDAGFRFKITYTDNNNISIERVPKDYESSKEFKIIENDLLLAGAVVVWEKNPVKYSRIQLGMANKAAFHERPKFYPKFETFND